MDIADIYSCFDHTSGDYFLAECGVGASGSWSGESPGRRRAWYADGTDNRVAGISCDHNVVHNRNRKKHDCYDSGK